MEGFRPDIEGLRAVAVVSVVLYHADLLGFRGGYIGVDVFFVLSGFLITRLLAGEVSRTGTISLRTFWARRARRLLPASSLTLVATVVASRFLVDPLTRGFIVRSGLASAGFAANVLF
ncbi:MAG: acyltransferase family protein, partial [Actinobacteria bacterium]|nr:acyltransferase family protein [Actinomycetota bacterium]